MSTEEWIARGALGLLSFIVLIIWLRWEGPREDQKKVLPRSQSAKQKTIDHSVGSGRTSISLGARAPLLRAMARSKRSALPYENPRLSGRRWLHHPRHIRFNSRTNARCGAE
jgi:hypothetical protein